MAATNTWLITGGAGYIGSHIADVFLSRGKEVVIYDSLESGLLSRVKFLRRKHNKEVALVSADLRDVANLHKTFKEFNPVGVVHAAALKSVAESMLHPEEYMDVNYESTRILLDIAAKHKTKDFIFASTAAIYGSPENSEPIGENNLKNPISPYGSSKLLAEKELNRYLKNFTFNGTSLRFFNVIGAGDLELMDTSVDNLVPIVINCLMHEQKPIIYGTDYKTPDGTCIRDYVDVRDIARACLFVADSSGGLPFAMNVGTGKGVSVREVIEVIAKISKSEKIDVLESDRRQGDPAILFADVSLIKKTLGFTSKFSLEDGIQSLYLGNS